MKETLASLSPKNRERLAYGLMAWLLFCTGVVIFYTATLCFYPAQPSDVTRLIIGILSYALGMYAIVRLDKFWTLLDAREKAQQPLQRLLHWHYPYKQWMLFAEKDTESIRKQPWMLGGIMQVATLLGASAAVLPRYGFERGFPFAFVLSAGFSVFLFFVIYYPSMRRVRAFLGETRPNVLVAMSGMLINQRLWVTFEQEGYCTLDNVSLGKKYDMDVVCFRIKMIGGTIKEEYLPIPRESMEQAKAMVILVNSELIIKLLKG